MAQQSWQFCVPGTLQAIWTSRQKCQTYLGHKWGECKYKNNMGFFPTVAVWEANFAKGVSLFIKVIFCGVFIVELPLFS